MTWTGRSTVATISTGRNAARIRPSRTLMTSIRISTTRKVSTEFTIVIRPVWKNEDSASTSVVILVMIRPVSSRS